MVRTEALVMSFSDVFLILTALFVGLALAIPFVRRPRGGGGGH
jgi:MFS transporter, DHA2 family, multidrug resistance protein